MHVTGHLKCFDERRRCKKKRGAYFNTYLFICICLGSPEKNTCQVCFSSKLHVFASPNNNKTSVKKEKYINKQGESLLKLNSKV